MRGVGCGCLSLLGLIGLVLSTRPHQPSARQVLEKAKEESVAVQAYEACRAKLPDLQFRRQKLVYRAPGRYQVVRRREHDQISCITWQGQIQFVDTAIIQPGNGVISGSK